MSSETVDEGSAALVFLKNILKVLLIAVFGIIAFWVFNRAGDMKYHPAIMGALAISLIGVLACTATLIFGRLSKSNSRQVGSWLVGALLVTLVAIYLGVGTTPDEPPSESIKREEQKMRHQKATPLNKLQQPAAMLVHQNLGGQFIGHGASASLTP